MILAADRVTKIFVMDRLGVSESIPVIKNIFHITLVYNTGAAFGIFRTHPGSFALVSICAILAMILFLVSRYSKLSFLEKTAILFIIGGAGGNLIDRIVYGHVIDFLDFMIWPVFNIADSFITIGVTILVLDIFLNKRHHDVLDAKGDLRA